jgi:hypothetical protein
MLKIENLNVGDKLYCVKTLNNTRKIFRDAKYYERLNYFNNKDWTDLTENEKIEYNNFDFRKEEEYEYLIKDKYYTIIDKFGQELEITTEDKYSLTISNSKLCDYKEDFLNEYFITEIEGRKIKFDSLSDNNFNSFLKKLKK